MEPIIQVEHLVKRYKKSQVAAVDDISFDVQPGALIPISNSSGILGLLAKLMPMTYSIDLARNIFYAGKPEYAAVVLHPAWLDLGVTAGLFLVFTIVGTFMFVRADRNR